MKTIEEAAVEYAAKLNHSIEAKHNMCPHDFEIAFKDGAAHIMSLPLAERLTEAEREKIKLLHHEASLCSSNSQPDIDELPDEAYKLFYMGRLNLIEQLFGSDMFTEGEDCK